MTTPKEPSRLASCRCYVGGLPSDMQFELRWGAHALDCPVYRPSRDPVDNAKDAEVRAALLKDKKGEVTKQVGNAVEVNVAYHLCRALIEGRTTGPQRVLDIADTEVPA